MTQVEHFPPAASAALPESHASRWSRDNRVVYKSVTNTIRLATWACAKTPLTQFDRKGDHLIRTPMHTQCMPDACPTHARSMPDAYPIHTPTHTPMQRSRLRSGHIGTLPHVFKCNMTIPSKIIMKTDCRKSLHFCDDPVCYDPVWKLSRLRHGCLQNRLHSCACACKGDSLCWLRVG